METLKSHFEKAKTGYARLKKECEAQVVRWEWGTWSLYETEPLQNLRSKMPGGRKIKTPPAQPKNGMHQYGFDAADRIVVMRFYTEFAGQFYEEFFVHAGDVIYGAYFDDGQEKQIINATRRVFQNGRLMTSEGQGGGATLVTKFTYEGDRVVKIIEDSDRKDFEGGLHSVEDVTYDEAGKVALIQGMYSNLPDRKFITYQLIKKGESIKELEPIISRKLVEQIPQAIKAAKIRGRAYCVILGYDMEGVPELPPILAVGLESQREKWLKEKGKSAKDFLWNAAEFEMGEAAIPQLQDAELIRICGLYNQQVDAKGFANVPRNLLNNVAAELNRAKWDGALDVTEDFLVVAVDFEGANLLANLKICVGKERVAELKAKKLI